MEKIAVIHFGDESFKVYKSWLDAMGADSGLPFQADDIHINDPAVALALMLTASSDFDSGFHELNGSKKEDDKVPKQPEVAKNAPNGSVVLTTVLGENRLVIDFTVPKTWLMAFVGLKTEAQLQKYLETSPIQAANIYGAAMSDGVCRIVGERKPLSRVHQEQPKADPLKLAEEAQAKAIKLMTDFVRDLCAEIRQTKINDAVPFKNGAVVISSSAIFGSRNMVLSAEYYSSEAQAKLVEQVLMPKAKAGQAIAIKEAIIQMCDSERVVVGGNIHRINEQTIDILAKRLKNI